MNKRYHLVGIAGIGMGALANLLVDKGFQVTGSDLRVNATTERLSARGVCVFHGHAPDHIAGSDCVVLSSAVDGGNPEVVEARNCKIPILKRAQLLAELMGGQIGITVAGAHGKTTVSAMIANLLVMAGLDPTTFVGGITRGASVHAKLGAGKYFVTEVDESDGSFLCFSPQYSVVTNIDLEHVDYYGGWQGVINGYKKFLQGTTKNGIILGYGDDERLLQLLGEQPHPFQTYGFLEKNNFQATDIQFNRLGSRFKCMRDGKNLGDVFLNVPGKHNIANALACIALGLSLSIDFSVICKSLKLYQGVERRFQLKGQIDHVWVVDDYAHHPTEIAATLETAQLFKQSVEEGSYSNELIAVFQPHRYSRVKELFEEFAQSLANCDQLIVTDIYAASEKPIEGVTAQALCQKVAMHTDKPVRYIEKERIINHLLKVTKPHDVVLTLGAGDITNIVDDFVKTLHNQKVGAKA